MRKGECRLGFVTGSTPNTGKSAHHRYSVFTLMPCFPERLPAASEQHAEE
jgi:hypothetical protein